MLFNRKKASSNQNFSSDNNDKFSNVFGQQQSIIEQSEVTVGEVRINEHLINKNGVNLETQEEIYEINSYNDAPKIADLLLAGGKVTINLLRLVREERLRTLDFFSGIIYAYHGTIKKVGNRVYTLSIKQND